MELVLSTWRMRLFLAKVPLLVGVTLTGRAEIGLVPVLSRARMEMTGSMKTLMPRDLVVEGVAGVVSA